ncbi:DNA internalization-related competence protein ComEC/Rec2 [Lysinibacillus odysseyi]|uniref:DNA internalization-related competence protein ComEC/Rec2 n=1 Tax=Lysinibacillus odysseyi TaxID=202611 RepID=UPI000A8C0E97|nr:DNA internalization-related competence protein ComEC/Rec2 [Lysinibacillus odysseyi]
MVNLKHKWIYYALSVLVAVLAAHESVGFLCFLVVIGALCLYRGFHTVHLMALAMTGILVYGYSSWQLEKLDQPLELPAVLTSTDTYTINGQTLRGLMKDSEGRPVYIVYLFRSEEEKQQYDSVPLAGTVFLVEGLLEEPAPKNHRYHFYMGDYLKSKGAIGILKAASLKKLDQQEALLQKIYEQRFRLSRHIERTFPASLSAEAQALLIGVNEGVEPEIERAYQKLGITHLFAISGLHIALVSLLFFQGLLRLHVRREFATLLLLIVLPVYALLAGGAPSVWRAVLVVELVLLAKYFRWHLPMDDALSISFILFVLWEPGSIYQIGFQLSYLATASLVFSGPILARATTWWGQGFLITFVCQLLTYPLLLVHFYELSISSFIANILFVPLFSFVILPINIILLIISFLPGPFGGWLFYLYEPARELLTSLILYLQDIPYHMWVAGKPTGVWPFILYISVFIVLILLIKKRYQHAAIYLLIPALLFHSSRYIERDVLVTFINVGQGDSILVELPYKRGVYLIDTGGVLRFSQERWKERRNNYEVGAQIVVPYLKGKGIAAIDKLIITHADADHVEGAEEVIKEIRVGEIHITPDSYKKSVMNDLLDEAEKQQIVIKEQMAGGEWKKGQAQFDYIWPSDTVYEGNNDSLTLLMTYKGFKGLFTGDLEEAGELALIMQEGSKIAGIDVLKAGHHGSKTSSSERFIDHTNPTLTVFMAGKDNRYGHPHEEVVNRFISRNLRYVTTGQEGTIEISINKNGITMRKQ